MSTDGFKRCDGFVGSIPQKFIDNNFKKCPMCGATEPHWTLRSKMSWTTNRNLFKCDKCACILSAEVAEIAGMNKTIITTTGLLKALSGKKNRTTYLRVDEVGTAQVTETYKGREMSMEELQALAEST
ncbi:MAG: hypothetical protein Q7T78_05215 [Rhodoferax sp.]|nr:hypothetical protein [Rhodoferax sp.]